MMLLDIQEPGSSANESIEKATIGIDLGTTNSLVAISNQGVREVIGSESGEALVPSVVAYHNQDVFVGVKALDKKGAIYSIKRLMGRAKQDISVDESKLYDIAQSANNVVMLHAAGRAVSAVEISAEILKTLKIKAEKELDNEVGYAVITVPAYFDDAARQATKDAATLAGMEVLRLVNEPTAAALAYGLDNQAEGIYAVYDLGGGTFDVSLLKMEKGVFQVLATGGDTALGGDDFDRATMKALQETYLLGATLSLEENITLKKCARAIKEALTDQESVTVSYGYDKREIEITFTQEEFEEAISSLVLQTIETFAQVVEDAAIDIMDIKGVVLVGGSTRVPLIQKMLEKFTQQKPLNDVDPDKVVAIGAAIQAEALSQGSSNLLLDVTPLSLGLETYGGLVETLIHRNTPIPTMASQKFTTYKDGQTGMSVHVLQGEREMVDLCRSLAKFELKGIPPMKAGVASIEIIFSLDADGLLTVSAKEETTGVEQKVEVKPSYGFSSDQIEKMLMESMEHAQEDITRRLLAESKVDAEITVAAIEAALLEDGEILEKNYYDAIKLHIVSLHELMKGTDRDAIDHSAQQLDKLTSTFAELRVNKALNTAFAGKDLEQVSRKVWEDK